MEHADPGACELGAGGEALGGLGDAAGGLEGRGLLRPVLVQDRRIGGGGLVLVDPGAHDEDLPARADLLPRPLPHALLPGGQLLVDHEALDPGAAAGALGEREHVEVADGRQRRGARDRRRRHHHDVRAHALGALRAQAPTMVHAEAVLLVDDHQPQGGELDALGEQRVGAHHDARLAGGDVQQRLAAGGGALGAGEQAHPGRLRRTVELAGAAELAEELEHGAVVLLGEDLGGGEHHGLVAGVDGAEHGAQGDDGLAGADVALEKGAGGVGVAGAQPRKRVDDGLPVGEGEGQARIEELLEGPVGAQLRGGGALVLGAALGEDRLEDEGLLEAEVGHAPAGVVHGQRGVDETGGLGEVGQAPAAHDLRGDGAGGGAGELEALLHRGAHRRERDVLLQGVDGAGALRPGAALLGVLDGLEVGMGELEAAAVVVPAHRAVHTDGGADGEALRVPLDVVLLRQKEGQRQLVGAVGDGGLDDEAVAGPHLPRAERLDLHDGADLLPLGDLAQGAQRGGLDVAARDEAEHGVEIAHAEGGHRLGLLGDQQLRQRHGAARGGGPPGHRGDPFRPGRVLVQCPSCHCPATS